MTLSISILCNHSESYYAECHVSFNVVLNVIMLIVIMLSVVMLNVVSPFWHNLQTEWEKIERFVGRHNTHHNDIQHNDTQPKRLVCDTQQK